MTKKMLWFVIGAVVLIAGAGTYVLLAGKKTTTEGEAESSQQETQTTPPSSGNNRTNEPSGDTAPRPGMYVDYTEEGVLSTPGDKLLFFHAAWCPQCRAAEADIKATTLPNNLTIFKVDYDTNQALRQKYGVTLQTTFVKVDDNGNLIESFVAYDEPTFEAVKRELLD